ncbi:hypothetical protein KIN20_016022 [Parelaphostrongylus tenuis]|uniref:Uncharacterized protein n=1 Tax=Parelaphostrongylus tenuis TaxID=148309 RepID=A0AAD5QQF6_PARTN|nr:hypothetical protein KIN20_016022 [Parelaphostrongylus tenuis]
METLKELILQLLEKLDKISFRSPALHEQRTILEHVQAIMFQLIDKGENVDNQYMYRKVLSKFPSDTQRKVLAKKRTAVFFDMQTLLQLLDEAISNEELISRYMTNARTPNTISIDVNVV